MQKSIIDPEFFQALKITTRAIPRPDLGRDISVAPVPDLSGFILFTEEGTEYSVCFMPRFLLQQVIAFVANGGRPEEALAYAEHHPQLLEQAA